MKKIISILMISLMALSINTQTVFAFDSGYTATDAQALTSDSFISANVTSDGVGMTLGGTSEVKPQPKTSGSSTPSTRTNSSEEKKPATELETEKPTNMPTTIPIELPGEYQPGTPGTDPTPGTPGTPDKKIELEKNITSGFTLDLGQLKTRAKYAWLKGTDPTPGTPGTEGVGEKIKDGLLILLFGLTPGEPDTTTVMTPEEIEAREAAATYQEPIDISGEWHRVIRVIHWDWTFHQTKDASIADMTARTPSCYIQQVFTKTGPYRATAKAWCRWEYGHYELRTDSEGHSYRVAVKDGEYDEYDLSRTKVYTFTIGYNDLNKPVAIPTSQATVTPVDELVE